MSEKNQPSAAADQGQWAYKPIEIEKKWQDFWDQHECFKTQEDPLKPKYYALDMFPYPSGAGLHVGHPEGYVATDIVSRYKRMRGFNVLHPMGWDAFGLPAEQYAVKTGTHPKVTTEKNVETFKRQIKSLGLSYDWSREINTTDPKYYKWTQWIFLKLFEKGLAYESHAPVNWCPALGAVLANEEVVDGKSEIGGHPVIRKPMRQWVLKITQYADRLIDDLEGLDWSESIKQMQRNWIGKSTGTTLKFAVVGPKDLFLEVFTTRVDTIFGVSFIAIAPEHPFVKNIQNPDVKKYVEEAINRSERERSQDKKKTGVVSGFKALNPLSGEEVPIFVADYVLGGYGSGAVMGVPAHDERDFEFADSFGLKKRQVIIKSLDETPEEIISQCFTEKGLLIQSGAYSGMHSDEAIKKITKDLEKAGQGQGKIQYKLRDWLFSRQRYWGEPIPIVHDNQGKAHPLSPDELPLLLPQIQDFKPNEEGESPLAGAGDWLRYKKDGEEYRRETNTMPQWAGSCWYYLRFIDPTNDLEPWSKTKESFWMPVDLYVGGAEHAVLHLLYARFWHKVLYDCGLVSTKEPFQKLVNQGMILGENNEKMSKSRGNVVNPDEVVRDWGADSLRLYEMFMGPLEATKPWQTQGIVGIHRFLQRVWRLLVNEQTGAIKVVEEIPSLEINKKRHQLIKKVTKDIEALSFNTAIAAMMEFCNLLYKEPFVTRDVAADLLLLLSPFAPHLCEEVWHLFGNRDPICHSKWPRYEEHFCEEDTITLVVQVNGKVRAQMSIDAHRSQEKDSLISEAKEIESVKKYLTGHTVVKEIFIPGKIINIVVKPV